MPEKENIPPVKKRRLSLSLGKHRFQRVSGEDVCEAEKGFVPSNTRRCNTWALNNFTLWLASLDEEATDDPNAILLTDDPKALCSYLCRFVMETRKENGEKYPPKTLFLLLSCLLRYMDKKNDAFNIFDEKDPNFIPLKKVMDCHFKQLHSEGVGTNQWRIQGRA